MNINGVSSVSISAATNNTPMAINNRLDASNMIFWKFSDFRSWFMTAADIIPPASPAIMYPTISGIPWNRYLENANPPDNTKGFDSASPFARDPMAAAMTVAFHVSMNIAPEP